MKFISPWHNNACSLFILDPLTIGDFAKNILHQLANQASLLSGLDNRQNLKDLYLFYGTNLYKCQIQHCPFSVKGFRLKVEYDLHSKDHEKRFKCHIKTCSYSEIDFLTAGELRLHVSGHSTIETTTDQLSNLRLSQDSFQAPRQRRPDELFEDAVATGDLEYVASVIEVDESMIKEYRIGKSTLILAIEKNQLHIMEFLLDRGVDFKHEKNPIYLAVENGSVELVRALLLRNPIIQEKDSKMYRALQRAVSIGDIKKVEFLLAFGAKPFYEESVAGPLYAAAESSDETILRLLLDFLPIDSKSSLQKALFHALVAAEKEGSEVFQILLKECQERTIDWNYCLQAAVERQAYQCARISIEQGADVNISYGIEVTTLMMLARESSQKAADLMKLLLENGADPSIKNHLKRGPGDYKGAKNIQKWLGVTWEELVEANAHKVIKPSDTVIPSLIRKFSVQSLLANQPASK